MVPAEEHRRLFNESLRCSSPCSNHSGIHRTTGCSAGRVEGKTTLAVSDHGLGSCRGLRQRKTFSRMREHSMSFSRQDQVDDARWESRFAAIETEAAACGTKSFHGRKTHCPQGHAYSQANTIVDGGARKCRTCRAVQQRLHLAQRVATGRLTISTKTHCKHGHEFTPENTARTRGARVCRECRAAALRNLRARRREAQP
jgi:hypothetical protein